MKEYKEINKEISVKVFHHVVIMEDDEYFVVENDSHRKQKIPNYAGDINWTFRMLKRLEKDGFHINIFPEKMEKTSNVWKIHIKKEGFEKTYLCSDRLTLCLCKTVIDFIDSIKTVSKQEKSKNKIINIKDLKP